LALVRTNVSEELSASIIRVTRIDELGTTLAITSNQHMLRRNKKIILCISSLLRMGKTLCGCKEREDRD
jgi:hypothetical protein